MTEFLNAKKNLVGGIAEQVLSAYDRANFQL